jgi:SAM-dependent methyltransferase
VALEEVPAVSRLVTGERVVTDEGGFNPSYQRHVATYRLCAPLLPDGRILDLGCGIGHSFRELAPRETVGVDVSADALAGQERETVVADMRSLPFADASFAGVRSVQAIEHVPDGGRVGTAAARGVEPGGVAIFVTPNRLQFARPDEIIDPYHYVEYSPAELRELCLRGFSDVTVLGLTGSERWRVLVDEELARLDALLRRDPLRLRRLVPRRARQLLYDWMLTRSRARAPDPRAAAIVPEDFRLVREDVDAAFDLVAVCRGPRP